MLGFEVPMPSPFPGMDPWLEHPQLWPDVHGRFIVTAAELLQQQLAPKYFAQIEERRYVANSLDTAAQMIVADVRVRESDVAGFQPPTGSGSAGATATIEPGIELDIEWTREVRENYIQVRDLQQNRVITVIEFLSPANKAAGSSSRDSYLCKREETIAGECNFVEIDLLRTGEPLYRVGVQLDYLAAVTRHRPGKKPRRLGWPIGLRKRLPSIPVPLKPEDGQAVLDLQSLLDLVYDRARYDLRCDYKENPYPRLDGVHDLWAHGLLTERRLR